MSPLVFAILFALVCVGAFLVGLRFFRMAKPPGEASIEQVRRFGRLLMIAALIGVTAPIVGLYVSFWANTASGATIVLVETGVFLLAIAAGQNGVLRRPRELAGAGIGDA